MQNERNPRGAFTYTVGVRFLAAGFELYTLWEIISSYLKGGEEAPSLTLLLLAVLVLGGGAVFIAWMGYKEWKKGAQPADAPEEAAAASEQEED